MAADHKDVTPIPVPPNGSTVVPIEPPPAVPIIPAGATNPYAAPAAVSALPYPAPDPYAATAAYPVAGPPQGLAITSMILGITGILLSFVFFGFLPALAAVITGHLAQKRQPHARGFWLTGIITGYVGIGIAVIAVITVIAIFVFAYSTYSTCGVARVC